MDLCHRRMTVYDVLNNRCCMDCDYHDEIEDRYILIKEVYEDVIKELSESEF